MRLLLAENIRILLRCNGSLRDLCNAHAVSSTHIRRTRITSLSYICDMDILTIYYVMDMYCIVLYSTVLYYAQCSPVVNLECLCRLPA